MTMKTITIQVEQALFDRVKAQAGVLAQSEAALLLGVSVDVGMAARAALIKGLDDLEQGRAPAAGIDQAQPPRTLPLPPAPSEVAKTPETEGPPEWEKLITDVEIPEEWPIPAGWGVWSEGELVPAEHGDAHAYYAERGWRRYYGTVGEEGSGRETIVFYWASKSANQEVAPFSGAVVQSTPWGPGHLLPRGFSERATADNSTTTTPS